MHVVSYYNILQHFFLQGGPENIQLKTIDSSVANTNFCEPPCKLFK